MLKRLRCFFRFRLATLLFLVTIFCIWLGIETHRARNQGRAVTSLKRAGAWVIYRQRFNSKSWLDDDMTMKMAADGTKVKFAVPAPAWALATFGEHYFVRPAMVALSVTENKESLLRDLIALDTLGQLDLSGITDGDLSGLEHLSQLKILNLCDGEITDASIPHLAKLRTLLKLDLGGTSISRRGYADLKTLLPNCEIIGDPGQHMAAQAPPTPAPLR